MSSSEPCNCDQAKDLQMAVDLVYTLLVKERLIDGREKALKLLRKKVSKRLL